MCLHVFYVFVFLLNDYDSRTNTSPLLSLDPFVTIKVIVSTKVEDAPRLGRLFGEEFVMRVLSSRTPFVYPTDLLHQVSRKIFLVNNLVLPLRKSLGC